MGKHTGSKTLAGARGREACGIPSGGCKDSFNLSIPPCPQQLLETEGFKTPWAETNKSRLGWNKKGEEIKGEKDGGDFSSQIWSVVKALAVTVPKPCQSSMQRNRSPGEGATWVCDVGHLWHTASQHLLANATINKNRFEGGGGVCFALLHSVCKTTAQNIHILSRTAEFRLQTQQQRGG